MPNKPVEKIGNSIHRETGWWTPAVHQLLKYLESVDFPYSPRVLGFDDDGREILSYFEGDSGADVWGRVVDEEGLKNFAKLLKAYHVAVAGFRPKEELQWAYFSKKLEPGRNYMPR